jgi:regulator of cell morphogenesis and NO signaling
MFHVGALVALWIGEEVIMPIHDATRLADIALTVPGAAAVFERHRLDYCCGGERTLRDACLGRNLDPARIAREIDEACPPVEDDTDWEHAPLDALIAHIVLRYHGPLRRELPRLIDLAARVERVHAAKPTCPHGLADHLAAMAESVSTHLMKEERILFPLLARGGAGAGMPIRVLTHEHLDHAATLERTRALTADLTPPAGACTSWRALYRRLADLEADLHRHIHLENNVLFPRALRAA